MPTDGVARAGRELHLNGGDPDFRPYALGSLGATMSHMEQWTFRGAKWLVASGKMVPVDGSPVPPSMVLDESTLTGESPPVERVVGDRVRDVPYSPW